jgi:hypothetical protein
MAMTIKEARQVVGLDVALTWRDRHGDEFRQMTHVYKADFLPFYGPCLITNEGEVPLDRVVACDPLDQRKIA